LAPAKEVRGSLTKTYEQAGRECHTLCGTLPHRACSFIVASHQRYLKGVWDPFLNICSKSRWLGIGKKWWQVLSHPLSADWRWLWVFAGSPRSRITQVPRSLKEIQSFQAAQRWRTASYEWEKCQIKQKC
jgi:hypothetical protein